MGAPIPRFETVPPRGLSYRPDTVCDGRQTGVMALRAAGTTQESDIALTGLSSDGTYTLATMSFRSTQDPGYGPATNPDDTCDDWTITYQLTRTKGYRIVKAPKEG